MDFGIPWIHSEIKNILKTYGKKEKRHGRHGNILFDQQPSFIIGWQVLITGNLGYIGPVAGRYLKSNNSDHYIAGIDSGFFAHRLTNAAFTPDIYFNVPVF